MIGATAVASALLLTACGSSGGNGTPPPRPAAPAGVKLVKQRQAHHLHHLPYEPFQFKHGGKVVGFDVDIIDLVAKELGVDAGDRRHRLRARSSPAQRSTPASATSAAAG